MPNKTKTLGSPDIKKRKRGVPDDPDKAKKLAEKRREQCETNNNIIIGKGIVASQKRIKEGIATEEDKALVLAVNEKKRKTAQKKHYDAQFLQQYKNVAFETNEEGEPRVLSYIKNLYTEAIQNPNSGASAIVAKSLSLDKDVLERIDKKLEEQMNKDHDFAEYRLLKGFFKEQQEFLLDRITKKKILCCGRRAGKSVSLAGLFCLEAMTPNSPMLYLHRSITMGIRNIFDYVVDIANKINLVIKASSKANGEITFNNGSTLWIRGLGNKDDPGLLRGFKYKVVGIDECAFLKSGLLREAIDEVIEPAQLDFGKEAKIVLSSSQPRIPLTYFETKVKSGEYKIYKWTMFDNPFIINPKEELDNICRDKGVTMEDTIIQREYLNENVYDTESRVYKDYLTYEEVPPTFKPTHIVGGLDVGFSDADNITLLIFNRISGEGYYVYEKKESGHLFNERENMINEAFAEARKIATQYGIPFDTFKFICDSADPMTINTMKKKWNIPIMPAIKTDKNIMIKFLGDKLRTKLYVKKDGLIDIELQQIIYKRDEETDRITAELDDDYFHEELTADMRYSFRKYLSVCGINENTEGEKVTMFDDKDDLPSHLKDQMTGRDYSKSSYF